MKKVIKAINHIAFDNVTNGNNRLRDEIAKTIQDNKANGLQSEVQYSTCADSGSIIYSALILGYTEE